LIIRRVFGSRGRGGLHYQVSLDSLPLDLQSKWRAEHGGGEIAPIVGPPVPVVYKSAGAGVSPRWERLIEMIGPALAHPSGSKARGRAIADIVSRSGKSPRSIRRFICRYEASGLKGLQRLRKNDTGRRRVIISRLWDALPIPLQTQHDLQSKLVRNIRSLWAADLPGTNKIARAARTTLIDLTRAAGIDPTEYDLMRLCCVPRSLVERERPYHIIAVKDRDARRWADEYVPRVSRSRAGLLPMEVLCGDVHPIDILVERPDGSIATPRAIAWHDLATNRVFITIVLLGKGEGVRLAHVVDSYIEMVGALGPPQILYLDNGSEYSWTDFIEPALRLVDTVRRLSEDPAASQLIAEGRRSMVIRAKPYNAPAKAIEGLFGVLEGGYFRLIPGWIGGNRMRKKTANLGRAAKPFPGTLAQFREAIAVALADYHATPQTGLGGKSPDQTYAEALAAGWKMYGFDRSELLMVFAREMIRTVRKGVVRIDGADYEHEELDTLTGCAVTVRVPLLGDGSLATAKLPNGATVALQRCPTLGVIDPSGARYQEERESRLNRKITKMKRDIDPIDPIDVMQRNAALTPPPPAPRPAAIVRIADDDVRAAAEAMAARTPAKIEPAGNRVAALMRADWPRRRGGDR
jgi:hypothetical protein